VKLARGHVGKWASWRGEMHGHVGHVPLPKTFGRDAVAPLPKGRGKISEVDGLGVWG
jgi:hypothetical protein